jgi:hypothetical protein
MLPEQRIAAARRIEKRPVKRALDFQQQAAGNERREREQDHRRRHTDIPDIKRNQIDAHSGRAGLERPNDHFHSGRDRRNLNKGETQQPHIRTDARLVSRGQRRIHEPAAARSGIKENRAAQENTAQQETPEAEGRQPREGQIARSEHLRQEQDRDRLENRNRKEKHHY